MHRTVRRREIGVGVGVASYTVYFGDGVRFLGYITKLFTDYAIKRLI